MAREDIIIDMANFKSGFTALEDTTKAPFGSFRVMRNAQVTDRGGIGPRPGVSILGTTNASTYNVKGLYTYKRSNDTNEFLVKVYDDELEAYSKNNTSQGWFRVKDGFTQDKEMGFSHSLFNTSNDNFMVASNRFDPYFKWTGATTTLSTTLAGAETSVTVASTLLADTYDSKTASANSATTLDIATAAWAASQWVSFYVYITSGVHTGKVRLISANTSTQITFTTLGSVPGNCTFEIRRLAFPLTGTMIYGGTTLAYTNIPTSTTFTVASANAAASGTIVTLVPENVIDAPRGNRITNYLGRMVVGNVRSALARDSGGTLQGYASGGTAFVSKLNDPFNYTFAATRVAGDGDMIAMPYGGGDITDVVGQEDAAYIFKSDYIEAVRYSQDGTDLVQRDPLKSGFGSIGKTTKGIDDVYFFTKSKQLTSLGRVATKDVRPETLDIGNSIKRYLARADLSSAGRGKEIAGKVYFPIKSSSTATQNDVMLVYNRNTQRFEGIWDLPAFGITEFNDKFYFAESNSANVYEMFTTNNYDSDGTNQFPVNFQASTHFFNLTPSHTYQQAIYGMTIEGYIRGGTSITYNVWKDFATNTSVSFTFNATETGFLDGASGGVFLADQPLGFSGVNVDYSDVDFDGRRHFFAKIYWPYVYGNHFSVGISSSAVGDDHETTRFGLILQEEPASNVNRVKSIA